MAAWLLKCGPGILTFRNSLATLIAVGLLAVGSPSTSETCSADAVDLRWNGGSVRFAVEVADDFEERSRGLMFREHLPTFSGMIFFFETEVQASFWMKNTLIPLDMLFVDRRGVVQKIHANAIPGDLTSIESGGPVVSVLEINGGLAAQLNIPVGAELRHPSFDQSGAAWAC